MEMFSKTKMCRFFILGKCAKGLQCPYAHDKRDLRDMPDLRCTKICNTLIQTGECNNKNCAYAHNHKELRSTAFQKTKLCRNLQFGRCPRGDKCNFAHSTTDIQPPTSMQAQSPTSMQALKMLPPGLGGYDGDDQSTQVSGGSGDSNSSDHGSVTASVNPLFEPAYIHIGAPPSKMELGHQRAFKQPMTKPMDMAPHNLGDMELGRHRPFKLPMTKQMETAPHSLGDIIRLSDYTMEPMQSRMNLPVNADFGLREYLNAIDQLVQENAGGPYPVLSV
jgi:hypothetical protein